jgi:hypothetical protein
MDKLITLIGFLFILSCSNTEYSPKYSNFDNDWERENLIGRVKSIEQFKANVSESKKKGTEKPDIQLKKEFSETGMLSYVEYFDSFGNLEYYIRNEFDSKGYRLKSITENYVLNTKSVEKNIIDSTTGKLISTNVNYSDSSYLNGFFKYDEKENLIEQLSVEDKDTTKNQFEYIFDTRGNIVTRKQIQKTEDSIYEYLNEYKYNQDNNLIELKSSSEFSETALAYEYDNRNRIKMIAEFNNGELQKESFYDKLNNQTLVKFYNNGSLSKEMKFEYELDKTGNWIKRKVFINEHTSQKSSWIPIYNETRKFEYYE